MNITEGNENWSELKIKLKTKISTLTDTDLYFEEGKMDEMLKKIQLKLGKTKEELQKIISAL
ncbi:MAG: general stress protein CsbD [Bacteroidales bacterium]